jgi:hypothetical protein
MPTVDPRICAMLDRLQLLRRLYHIGSAPERELCAPSHVVDLPQKTLFAPERPSFSPAGVSDGAAPQESPP